MADASKLRQGSIVWIGGVADPQGRNPKPHPRAFVIINRTEDIKPGAVLVGVAVTSTYREPVADTMVPMRWNAAGTTETGFRRKCFAKVDWMYRIPLTSGKEFAVEFDGEFEGKRVRPEEMLRMLEAMAKVSARQTRHRR